MSSKTYQIIIGILLLLLIVLSWNAFRDKGEIDEQRTEISTLELEKADVLSDLQNMSDQYAELYIEADTLNSQLLAEKQKIDSLISEIGRFKSDDKKLRYEIAKWKRENETLRKIMKGYLVEIDSLQQSNMALTAEKTKIATELQNVSSEKEKLAVANQEKDNVIKQGSVLSVLNLTAVPIRIKNNGNQVETSKASRAEKIKTCCALYENKIAKSGMKNIYVRIISPEGIVLSDSSNPDVTFNFDGVSGKYSAKRQVDYQNETIEGFCVFYDISGELATGLYKVEIYDEDALMGTSEFELR